jgi:hypothetical protein
MPSTISAGTTGGTAIAFAGDTSGELQLRTNGTTPAVTISTAQNATFAGSVSATNTFGFKNRIINGAMVIDQRNAGAAVTAGDTYPVDRFSSYRNGGTGAYTAQQSSTAPTGFRNSIIATVTSAGTSNEASIYQVVEGFNIADLMWGTANAKTVTLSFWVRSSVAGSYSLSFRAAGGTRSYVTTYTISSANTFEFKTITIAGDTSGTWNTTNGAGIIIDWSLGQSNLTTSTLNAWQAGNLVFATGATNLLATSGATFYITGVQLEVGSLATSFDFRSIGQELALCQRYCYQITYEGGDASIIATGYWGTGTLFEGFITPKVTMRTTPTLTISGQVEALKAQTAWYNVSSIGFNGGDSNSVKYGFTTSNSGESRGLGGMIGGKASGAYGRLSAEL